MSHALLTRLGNALLVVLVGMAAGHLLAPARPGAALARMLAFVALVAASGALAGWREMRLHDALPRTRTTLGVALVGGALGALALAWVAFGVVHG